MRMPRGSLPCEWYGQRRGQVAGGARVVEGDRVRRVQSRDRIDLLTKTPGSHLVGDEIRLQYFHSHVPFHGQLLGDVDPRHVALAK